MSSRWKLPLLILLALALCLAVPSIGLSSGVEDLAELSGYYLQKNNFAALTSLFLLPGSYSAAQISEEKTGLRRSLEFLSSEFGSFDHYSLNDGAAEWYELFVAGGDVSFLKENPDFRKIVYKTDFSKLGSGFIIFQIYENNGNPKLRAIGLALVAAEKNVAIVKAIGKKMSDNMLLEAKKK